MRFVKGLLLSISVTVLLLSLLGTAWSYVGLKTVHDRDIVKGWLDDSNFYGFIVDRVIDNVVEGSREQGTGIAADDAKVSAIAKQVFNDDFVQKNSENVLDGVYDWLSGKTGKPEFSVDFSKAKDELATSLGAYAAEKAATLPTCTPDQITAQTDPFTATCLPPGVNPQQFGDQVKSQLLSSEGFLNKTTFSGDDIQTEKDGQLVPISQSAEAVQLQRAYKVSSYMPILLGAIALASAVVIILLSATLRHALRRIGIATLLSGILLAVSYLVMGVLSNRAVDADFKSTAAQDANGVGVMEGFLKDDTLTGLIRIISTDVRAALVWFVIGYILLGIILIVISVIMGRRQSNDNTDDNLPPPPTPERPKAHDAAPLPGTERPTARPTTAPPIPPRRTQPRPAPRKIQL